MLLAIDAGNTNIVFALFDGAQKRAAWRISSSRDRTAEEYAVWLCQLMALEGIDRTAVADVIIASVVPEALFALRSLAQRFFSAQALVVGEDLDPGVEIRIDKPQEVGADRVANAVGAQALAVGAVLVIDFGTATTFDMVDAKGDYIGGVIAPGPHLSLDALYRAASKLPQVSLGIPAQVIGRDTKSAMQSGVYWGYVALIEGLVQRIRSEFGGPMTVVATGGLAPLFRDAVAAIERVEEDLTISGLVLIYHRNRKKQ